MTSHRRMDMDPNDTRVCGICRRNICMTSLKRYMRGSSGTLYICTTCIKYLKAFMEEYNEDLVRKLDRHLTYFYDKLSGFEKRLKKFERKCQNLNLKSKRK